MTSTPDLDSSLIAGREHNITGRSATSLLRSDSVQRQMSSLSSQSSLQGGDDGELPPPAYEIVANAGNSIHQINDLNLPHATSSALSPDPDIKYEVTIPRDLFVDSSSEAGPSPDTETMYEPFSASCAYARPPVVPQITGVAASNTPPDYMVPSVRTDMYPRYSSPASFNSPPRSMPPTHNLLSLVGGGTSTSSHQNPGLPPSFARPPPPNLYYNTFPPTYLIANGRHLDDGFPVVPPPSLVQPHPFSLRDVREVDWIR